ncbi:ArpU family phage packaging/lysis transcriptional regulator [Heyndrickxia oleronia]|jgi:ArpU family phage transcriptional regulator|uniref:ArpU family phage packaging/lysis transcriptional regulator n=1 Tax=Heyndrickxia oleronia TaxID=38875 RepID=UPI00242B7BCA|nr:ArpU family phage packaging/lysis transcriptional regulator [Heyndrickxia oleronia]MCI1593066.1 ArpU family transcriptional regulator [Heyndrickxia oleronia]MCI1615476.1 ArpU family transcriptional regulator [Heyndrickxia oleronia]MCI1746174.1 ArpU family transcriptional regulator [Heyndrickxia oleronia]MCI1763557.1 ArpU family transcriptional regulator [Heyndrickxia oleronia]
MATEQLTMFEDIDESLVRSEVVKALIEYRALKVQKENMEERIAAGAIHLYPSVREVNPLNNMKVRQMEKALEHSLNEDERLIIEKKYLSGVKVKDTQVYMDLGFDKDRYYEIKRSAILLIATALGII